MTHSIGGKYSLLKEIARGGMGEIWEAFDEHLKRRVAVKRMSRDANITPMLRSRFEREALAIAQLKSPNVIQIYDFGFDDGSPFLVMELLEGEDLDARLKRQRKLALSQITPIITQIAKALTAAHGAGIVHRDLKPANIFLARGDGEETIRVLDFGVAAISEALAGREVHGTQSGALLGTPLYMSPEQARSSRNVDHRSDLWSLAVVAYRALTGAYPFSGESLGDLIVNICTDAPMPPSHAAPELGAAVDQLFSRALARDPNKRFQSARELAAALSMLETEGAPRAARILVVDDEPDVEAMIRQRFRQQIRKGVFQFSFAQNGVEALDKLREDSEVDAVLTDINMPQMDGLTLLGRAMELSIQAKFIVVSAYGDMANIRTAMNRGAFDFLVKPIDLADLEATMTKTVKHVVEHRRALRSVEESNLLRTFLNHGFADRALPALRAGQAPPVERVEATVAIIDIVGFVRAARGVAPDAVVRRLNANFEVIVPEVVARGGRIDKFIGDAVMVVFMGDGHAERALDACVAVREQLADLAKRAGEQSPYAHGVAIGVGSGPVVLGGIGAALLQRVDYTVVGEAVLEAERLHGLAARGEVLVTESLYDEAARRFVCDRPVTRGNIPVYNVVRRLVDEATASSTPTLEVSGVGVATAIDAALSPSRRFASSS